jgi:hypothetical protein
LGKLYLWQGKCRTAQEARMTDVVTVQGNELQDFFLILRLLKGSGEFHNRIPFTQFPEEKSDEEKAGMAALAKSLRSDRPMDRQFRIFLADLFDPDAPVQRVISFKRRKRGRWSDIGKRRFVASRIFDELHLMNSSNTLSSTLENLASYFGLSKKQIEEIWYEQRNFAAAKAGFHGIFDDPS